MTTLIVNTVEKQGGGRINLPSTLGNEGEVAHIDSSGNVTYDNISEAPKMVSKGFDLTGLGGTSATSQAKIMWTDVVPGVTPDEIALVKVSGHLLQLDNVVNYYGFLDENSELQSLTTEYGYQILQNGATQRLGASTATAYQYDLYGNCYGFNTGESSNYGSGMIIDHIFNPTGTTKFHRINLSYQQNTSNNFPTQGHIGVKDRSGSDYHGIMFYSNGDDAFHDLTINVDIVLRG